MSRHLFYFAALPVVIVFASPFLLMICFGLQTPHLKRYGRLYAKATFTGYKRGLRNQHENTALLKVAGCVGKEDSRFYVGKKCVFVYRVSTSVCYSWHILGLLFEIRALTSFVMLF